MVFALRHHMMFYCYNLIGGNFDDTFGNTVTPESGNFAHNHENI